MTLIRMVMRIYEDQNDKDENYYDEDDNNWWG
jgi:hypothetical protein